MLSLERVRQLLAGLELSDAELDEARVTLWLLAGLVCDERDRRLLSEPPASAELPANHSNHDHSDDTPTGSA
jgi:hypothetical protein